MAIIGWQRAVLGPQPCKKHRTKLTPQHVIKVNCFGRLFCVYCCQSWDWDGNPYARLKLNRQRCYPDTTDSENSDDDLVLYHDE